MQIICSECWKCWNRCQNTNVHSSQDEHDESKFVTPSSRSSMAKQIIKKWMKTLSWSQWSLKRQENYLFLYVKIVWEQHIHYRSRSFPYTIWLTLSKILTNVNQKCVYYPLCVNLLFIIILPRSYCRKQKQFDSFRVDI